MRSRMTQLMSCAERCRRHDAAAMRQPQQNTCAAAARSVRARYLRCDGARRRSAAASVRHARCCHRKMARAIRAIAPCASMLLPRMLPLRVRLPSDAARRYENRLCAGAYFTPQALRCATPPRRSRRAVKYARAAAMMHRQRRGFHGRRYRRAAMRFFAAFRFRCAASQMRRASDT